MAQKRTSTPPASPSASTGSREKAESAPKSPAPLPLGALIGLGLLALVAAALYYYPAALVSNAALEEVGKLRRTMLGLVMTCVFVPDDVLAMWCGGKVEQFSIVDRMPIALATGAILLGAWLAGALALDGLRITPLLDRLERAVFSLAVGLNLLSLYALAVGLAGGLQQRWLFVMPLVGLVAYGVVKMVRLWRQRDQEPVVTAGDSRRWYWWLLAAAPFALVIVLGAMLPPSDYDVREYHLQVPKEWHQQGRIAFLPHNIYGNMPLGSELTALWGMALIGGDDAWWWGALAGKTVMGCYALITAAGLVAFGRRVHSLAAGVFAAVMYLSTPWIVHVSVVGHNEGAVGLYCLTAIYALWLAWKAETPAAGRLALLAGFCAGAAVACKYPPALFLVVPLTIWLAFHPFLRATAWPPRPSSATATALSIAMFLTGVSSGCGLWLAKNAIQTGNPVYPLLCSIFDGRTRTPEKDQQWKRVHSPQPDASGSRFSPGNAAFQLYWLAWGTKWASIALLPLAAVAWLAREQRGLIALLALWLLFVFAAWWLMTHRLDRFLVPTLPIVASLGGIGAAALPHRAWRIAVIALILWGAITQFPTASWWFQDDNRYFAPLAALRRDDPDLGPLSGKRVEFAHQWLNEHVPPAGRVLLVGDAEPFDLEMPAVYNTCFDDCQFTRLFQGRTREERLAALQDEHITHVFISWFHLARYRSPGNYGYTSDYIQPDLVHDELVRDQRLLRPIPIPLNPDTSQPRMDPAKGELFEVVAE
ncbi:MAG TPA: hypothetical protein VFV87_10740 [Pirellulaceae bacterium]|nr:hypothetical protein [Pirellulaceae bacterium]